MDAIAKNESARGQAPQSSVDLLTSATALVQHSAAQTGTATHLANNFVTTVTLDSGKVVQKTIRDAQEPPARAKVTKAVAVARMETKRPRVEPDAESSEWDSDDERSTYGPNTRRSRRAAQKVARKIAEEATLKRVIADLSAGKDEESRTTKSSSEQKLAAARLLTAAANSGSASSSNAPCESPAASSLPPNTGASAVEKNLTAAPATLRETSDFRCCVAPSWPAASPNTAWRTSRDRPTRGARCTTANATAAAVQALLNG